MDAKRTLPKLELFHAKTLRMPFDESAEMPS